MPFSFVLCGKMRPSTFSNVSLHWLGDIQNVFVKSLNILRTFAVANIFDADAFSAACGDGIRFPVVFSAVKFVRELKETPT